MARRSLLIVVEFVLIVVLGGLVLTPTRPNSTVTADSINSPPLPVVAIHVSENTQNLEYIPATAPTPTGPETTGNQWWITNWRYLVASESLKETLRSDGTPFIEVSDEQIAGGLLLHPDGSPRYPIVFSLVAEAAPDLTISGLRDYAAAGGFVYVGGSSFTRNPDGTARGDFALANEMGVHLYNSRLNQWRNNSLFTKVSNHRLLAGIPWDTRSWKMPWTADEISWDNNHGTHLMWRVWGGDAEVIANKWAGPLLTVKDYGQGKFMYHAAFQPLIGHGGRHSSMYSYLIVRNAIEWAFESNDMPFIKLSPWPYSYDAAFIVRHDFENYTDLIQTIEASAQYEQSIGVKGDYYFCTGVLRAGSEDVQLTEDEKAAAVESMRRAVSLYGATIGSHNGGLANPVDTSLPPSSYEYWHWGPDRVLDSAPSGYTSGKDYALASIALSFQDIEGWLSGLDNGRQGCGSTDTCPRIWASPTFHATREDSMDILSQLNVITAGEQKMGPYPHWTLSTGSPGTLYGFLSLPVSDWYAGYSVAQSLENHQTTETISDLVDFYYELGALINLYGHSSSTSGLQQHYVNHSLSKPKIWSTNSVGIYDWWSLRSPVVITPSYSMSGTVPIASVAISGAEDPDSAIEVYLPDWNPQIPTGLEVFLDGNAADSSDYRITKEGVKVRVGSSVSQVDVHYFQAATWSQSDWSGGPGQSEWVDTIRYDSASGINDAIGGQLRLSSAGGGEILFTDDFEGSSGDPLSSWTQAIGSWDVSSGELHQIDPYSTYNYIYSEGSWTDYSVEGRIQLPAGVYGGGIGGRLDPALGTHYAAWIHPDGSPGGSNVLKLIKFRSWTRWISEPMKEVAIPDVGTDWHTLKLAFTGNRIEVYYDGDLVIDMMDNRFGTRQPYQSGRVSVDSWVPSGFSGDYAIAVDDIIVRNADQYVGVGNLLSSAFYGDDGVQWRTVDWRVKSGENMAVRVRTRTADQQNQLSSAAWSDWATDPGSPVTSDYGRWIQYEVELSSEDSAVSPSLFDIELTYNTATGVAPTSTATATSTPTATATDTPLPTSTATSSSTPTPTPTNTPTPTSTATPLPSITPTITSTPLPTDTPTPTPTDTPSPTPTATMPPDFIFADDYESGDLSAWSDVQNSGDNLSVSTGAALEGSYGMLVVIDSNSSMYVVDDSPNEETHYRASFLFDPNSIAMSENDKHFILRAFDGRVPVMQIRFRYVNSQYELNVGVRDDTRRLHPSSMIPLSDSLHKIEFDWRAAAAEGSNDGGIEVWLDDISVISVSNLDSDSYQIDAVRMGAVSSIDTGTRGTYYFDSFESSR